MTCNQCRFWQQHTSAGFCLRYPPVPVSRPDGDAVEISSSVTSEWPETLANEWCGEWQAKPETAPQVVKTHGWRGDEEAVA